MKPPRTALLAAAMLALVAAGSAAVFWPKRVPERLSCRPEEVRLLNGVATCGEGTQLTGHQLRALGGKLDLNAATLEELASLPGVGARLARDLAEARQRRPFSSWEEVDEVRGVGPATLHALKLNAVLGR